MKLKFANDDDGGGGEPIASRAAFCERKSRPVTHLSTVDGVSGNEEARVDVLDVPVERLAVQRPPQLLTRAHVAVVTLRDDAHVTPCRSTSVLHTYVESGDCKQRNQKTMTIYLTKEKIYNAYNYRSFAFFFY